MATDGWQYNFGRGGEMEVKVVKEEERYLNHTSVVEKEGRQ